MKEAKQALKKGPKGLEKMKNLQKKLESNLM